MGNQNSSPSKKNKRNANSPTATTPSSQSAEQPTSPTTSESRGMIRSPSGADFRDTNSTNFAPIEQLAKILTKKNETEGSGSGISDHVFAKYVFPNHNDLGVRIFRHFHTLSHAKTTHLGTTAFKQQVERFMSILDDQKLIELYVRIFGNSSNDENASKEGVKSLLRTSFEIAMTFNSGDSHSCSEIESTLDSVVDTCFFQDSLSTGFVSRWLEENCSRIILPVHRYVLHMLTTSYRTIQTNVEDKTSNGLELATPVLETQGKQFQDSRTLLSLSSAWFLAGTLPPIYSRPQVSPKGKNLKDTEEISNAAATSSLLPSQAFLSKVVPVVPSHWTLLYDTMEHGVGANRFLHHVLGYKGPTLTILKARSVKEDIVKIFCVASSTEWRETHLYIGGEDSCLLQVSPKFSLMEKGGKILYLNTHIRGYPKGLRVATDPRNPIIAVDEHFENVDVHAMPHILLSIEVWGCGDKSSRDVQLDIKKWQVKEAERQRTVKLSASDWLDHPDRYLLEMGGRPQYNNSKN